MKLDSLKKNYVPQPLTGVKVTFQPFIKCYECKIIQAMRETNTRNLRTLQKQATLIEKLLSQIANLKEHN